jgi:hypothetical protein
MWGSDYTRMRWLPVKGDLAPRSQWKLYSDCLNFLRDTDELSPTDKELLLGDSLRKVFGWPSVKD